MREFLITCMALSLGGCAVGPDYQRPDVETPAGWRVDYEGATGLANTAWWEQFQDARLNDLIRTALRENKDLRIASYRVEEFAARARVDRAGLFPQFGYAGSASYDRFSERRAIPLPRDTPRTSDNYEVGASLSWELDVWGRLRRASEAARADLLSAEESQRGVILTLVSGVASAYVQLLSLDQELDIARRTLKSREESLRLFESRYAGGAISVLELAQARSVYEQAAAVIPAQERQIALLENALSVLLGGNPGSVARDRRLGTLPIPPVPQGIPSDILINRPDVRQAEQDLVAANARIGVAKALYFPTISLTGLFGYASTELNDLLEDPASFGTGAVTALGYIFAGGRIAGEVRRREAVQKQLVANYQRTIQTAFREVEDALVSHQKFAEQLEIERRKVKALQDYARLARKRYEGGYSSYIEVLDAERSLYAAEITEAQTHRDVYLALIAVYKAMGGGWRATTAAVQADAQGAALAAAHAEGQVGR